MRERLALVLEQLAESMNGARGLTRRETKEKQRHIKDNGACTLDALHQHCRIIVEPIGRFFLWFACVARLPNWQSERGLRQTTPPSQMQSHLRAMPCKPSLAIAVARHDMKGFRRQA